MMAPMSAIAGSRCGATRQICRSRTWLDMALMSHERRLALLDKSLGRFLVVRGLSGAGVVHRLTIEAGFQRQMLGIVDVALDIAERDRGTLRQRQRELVRGGVDL